MTEVVVFENAGEIDPLTIKTFGVSVKETDSPIGFFGTGLKYAVAILLRTGHKVTVQSGVRSHAFGLQTAEIRGQQFNLVTMDGETLGYTDQVGKNWEVWMAYRELHCNCQDEAGSSYLSDEAPEPVTGLTRVVVEGADFLDVHRTRSDFLLTGERIAELDGVDVYAGEARGLFYRGVLVHRFPDVETKSRFTYCMTRDVDLTEDRTAQYPSFLSSQITAALIGSKVSDRDVLKAVLVAGDSYYEHAFDFKNRVWGVAQAGEVFVGTVEELSRDRVGRTNRSAVVLMKDVKRKELGPTPMALTAVNKEMLERAINFCKKIGCAVGDYPIVVTDTLGQGILGMAEGGKIYVSNHAFMQGTKRLAGTLFEEFCHLRYDYRDETRAFQDFLVDKLVSLGEEATGEPL